MAFKMKELSYFNLKYVDMEGVTLELDKDLILLDGPNGYGKSTTFDAIELLLTGKIKHSIKKRLDILANNKEKDICIKGIFNSGSENVEVKRIIKQENKFLDDLIFWNNHSITQEELCNRMNFTENSMGVAIYVSQLNSLDYLEQKENKRKTIVAELIDDKGFKAIKNLGDTFKKQLTEKLDKEIEKVSVVLEKEKQEKNRIVEMIKNINDVQGKTGYERLFVEKEYLFDAENMDKNIGYVEMTKPVRSIKEFLENKELYTNSKRNRLLDKVLNLKESQFKAFFYQGEIQSINKDLEIYQKIEKLERMIEKRNESSIDEINILLNVTEEEKLHINEVMEGKASLKITSSKNEQYIVELKERRRKLFGTYSDGVEKGLWDKSLCPFCGNENKEIERLFCETEAAISENNKALVETIEGLNKEIHTYFEARKKEIDVLIEQNKMRYEQYLNFKEILNVVVGKEEEVILKEKKFNRINYKDFKNALINLKSELEKEKRELGNVLEEEIIEKYDSIKKQYYGDGLYHTIEQIDNKLSYIAECYGDDYQKELSICNDKINKLIAEQEMKKKVRERALGYVSKYMDKYNETLKEYQTNLVKRIMVPLYIYSGKIIQNYPLGLGIIAVIENTQVVFKTEKKEEDIFEYLSAGQLNGAMLSIMLAVRSVIDLDKSLNMILIDDPLQTIDDVSAFSYADLLAEQFGDAQIILSTHEDEKSDLLEFKFKQHERTVGRYNMHDRYLYLD